MFSWVSEEAWAPTGRRRGSSSWAYENGREWGAAMLIALAFFFFFLLLNLSVCDLTQSLLQEKGLEVEKLECCKTWLSQHVLSTPDRTSPLPSLAPPEPTSHKPLAQSVLLL